MTDLLGADRVVALDVTFSSGTAWVCTDVCGETALDGSGPPDPAFVLSLHLDDASSGFQGEYSVGPITASPPAAALTVVPGTTRHTLSARQPVGRTVTLPLSVSAITVRSDVGLSRTSTVSFPLSVWVSTL